MVYLPVFSSLFIQSRIIAQGAQKFSCTVASPPTSVSATRITPHQQPRGRSPGDSRPPKMTTLRARIANYKGLSKWAQWGYSLLSLGLVLFLHWAQCVLARVSQDKHRWQHCNHPISINKRREDILRSTNDLPKGDSTWIQHSFQYFAAEYFFRVKETSKVIKNEPSIMIRGMFLPSHALSLHTQTLKSFHVLYVWNLIQSKANIMN